MASSDFDRTPLSPGAAFFARGPKANGGEALPRVRRAGRTSLASRPVARRGPGAGKLLARRVLGLDAKHLGPVGPVREAEVRIAQGETAGKICRGAGISEQTYYKWRREYGGLKIDQAKRLKELERENERLKKAVSELTLDKQILKEALSGKY